MSETPPFTDPDDVDSMEAEHLVLWRAFLRACSPLLVSGARVLDFGCSRGGLLSLLSRSDTEGRLLSLGVGIDVEAPAMRSLLARAAERNRGLPLLFSTSNPRSFPNQFDLVLSHEVVYLLRDLRASFADIYSALASGGHFCFTTGCHTDNPLYPRWRVSLEALGLTLFDYAARDFEAGLRVAGFSRIHLDRLRLSPGEYREWVRKRDPAAPNPAWFAGPSEEEDYYVRIGKLLVTAQKE
jgi:SAM-dependent methyltransferase